MATYADIFAFTDFRKFLAEYFKVRSEKESSFTQAYICRKLGLPNTRSFFSDVLRGGKPLSPSKTEALIGVLELKEEETKYFRTLVLHNQSALPSEKGYYLEQLISSNRSPTSALEKKSFEYYRSWQHSTIRALLDIMDVDKDLSPLVKAIFPPLPLPKVRESFNLLKKLGLIRRNQNGHWKPAEKSIHSGTYLQDEIVKQYQIQCLDVAKAAILSQTGRLKNIATETISVSESGCRAIEERMEKFLSDVRALVRNDGHPADRVYQLNIQLFPQSK